MEHDAPATLESGSIRFVGREDEVGDLRSSLDAALGGSTRLVLVAGEPGIGKTSLANVLVAEAASRGVAVWWGRCWEDGTAPAFWPWNSALARWTKRAGNEVAIATVGPLAAELSHVFPVLRERIPDLPLPPTWESDQARLRLFDTVSRFLAAQARPKGLVIVLDDVQWADVPSLKLLEFVAADLRDARLLVVATYRDTEVVRGHPFFGTLARLTREPSAQRLTLGGLSSEDCARYVAAAGGDGQALGPALHRETAGNPFFLGEVVRLLDSEGRLRTVANGWRVPPAFARSSPSGSIGSGPTAAPPSRSALCWATPSASTGWRPSSRRRRVQRSRDPMCSTARCATGSSSRSPACPAATRSRTLSSAVS